MLDVLSAAVKKNAALGYDYVAAPASAELLFLRHMPDKALKPYFNILRTVVLTSRHEMDPDMMVEASLKIDVHGNVEHTAAAASVPCMRWTAPCGAPSRAGIRNWSRCT